MSIVSNTARRVRGGPDLPATCSFKEVFIKSGAAAGFYICLSSNVWTGPFDVSSDSGDVVGPASATDHAIARYDLTTGKLLQNSAATVDDGGSVNLPTGQTYKINNVALAKGNVGLGSVDNTSDAAKPVSTATQTALDLKANDVDVVHETGDETIAGVKTFSSDPLIPDEAYGVGWNGSLEPPTKNAVYDKVETLAALSPLTREITAATDTITQADNGKIVRANRATGQTLTVTGPFTAGFNCVVIQEDAGQTTFAAGGGATVINRQTHTKIAGEGGQASLICYVADSLILGGDTAA